MTPRGSILTLNAGSSSLKFALFDAGAELQATVTGEVANLDSAPALVARDPAGKQLTEQHWPEGQENAFDTVLGALLAFADDHLGREGLAAVGHRIVHGGPGRTDPAMITPALLDELDALTPLDPLHMPKNLAPIRAVSAARPRLPHIACFDTAFHHTMPPVAKRFALPRDLADPALRRYGFHGLSYEYIAGWLRQDAPALARGRIIVAHLGSGASLCAMRDGVSIATTMGFSALEGLVMASRCGRLDPGVMLYLMRKGRTAAQIEDMLYRHSGMLGMSGISGDVRVLLASADPHAREALESFTYSIACEAGGLVSALGGLDGLVFTAGIGQHAPEIRAAVCERLAWLGLRLDDKANGAGAGCISLPGSAVDVRVVAANEEAVIARHTQSVLLNT